MYVCVFNGVAKVGSHTVLVDCGMDMQSSVKWNKFCRKHKTSDDRSVGFIRAKNHGLAGYVFTDLGDKFSVRDMTGEPPVTRIIDTIDTSKKDELLVHLLPPPDGRMHNLEETPHEGWVSFEEVPGTLGKMINNQGAFEIKHAKKVNSKGKEVFDPYSLRVLLPKRGKLPEHTEVGGTITQVKQTVDIKYRSLEENILQPIDPVEKMLLFTDGAKFGRADQLHIAFAALWQYEKRHKKMPKANDEEAILEVLKLANEVNEAGKKAANVHSVDAVDEDVVKNTARFAECTFQPMTCFFGGVVAQEVVKLTGKFTPLRQWLHLDCFEVMPELCIDEGNPDVFKVSAEDRKPVGSRYDDLIMILGRPLHTKLMKSKTFMVGCGALGCELLKNLALLGMAADPEGEGLVTVTDNDQIEVSNLSRQFLFREENVGQSKSVAATDRVVGMNKDFHVKALETLVEPRTENVFNQEFWSSLDWVTNALDNVKARQYVDSKCVFYEKPLLESGTLGTKCNAQVIMPHMTSSYTDGPKDDDAGDSIPMCTLRNFPSQIEHCIEWARAQFNDMFTADATKAVNFIDNPTEWLSELKGKTVDLRNEAIANAVSKEISSLKAVHRFLMQGRTGSVDFETCVKEAFALFHLRYRDAIDSLTALYPEDYIDKDGNAFWSGTKRFPQSAKFDTSDEMHINYIISAANIFAVNFGLQSANIAVPPKHEWRDPKFVGKIIDGLEIPAPVKQKVDMSGGGEEDEVKKDSGEEDAALIEEFESLLKDLEELSKDTDKLEAIRVEPADFEKDDDKNFHIDFITAASNLRAWNYKLKLASRHKAKMIAGKIIPAIATTTAAVTGLVCIELLKVIQPGKTIEGFKDSSNSLGINGYFFSEPLPPIKAKDEYDYFELAEIVCKPQGFTKWDKTLIEGELTLQAFLDQFKEKTGLNCTSVSFARESATNLGPSETIYSTEADTDEDAAIYQGRLGKGMLDLITELYGAATLRHKNYIGLECSVKDDEDSPFKVPQLIYKFA